MFWTEKRGRDAQHRRESNSEKNIRGRPPILDSAIAKRNLKRPENKKSAGSIEREGIDLSYTLNISEFRKTFLSYDYQKINQVKCHIFNMISIDKLKFLRNIEIYS